MDWSALAGPAVSLASTILSNKANRSNTRLSYQLAQENWQKQFDFTNAYNSPANQLKLYSSIGVNPYVNSQNSAMIGGASSNAQPQFHPLQSAPVDYSNSLQQVMSAILASSQAAGQNITNKHTDDLLNAQLQKQLKDANLTELQADLASIEKDYKRLFNNAQLRKMFTEYQKLLVDISVGHAEEKHITAQTLRERSEAFLNAARTHLTQRQVDELDIKLEHLSEYYVELIETEQAKQEESRSAAAYDNARKKTEDDLRTGRVDYGKALAETERSKADIAGKYAEEEKETIIGKLQEELSILQKDDDTYYYRLVQGILTDIAIGAVGAGVAGRLFKFAKGLSKLRSIKKASQAEKIIQDAAKGKDGVPLSQYFESLRSSGKKPSSPFMQTLYTDWLKKGAPK